MQCPAPPLAGRSVRRPVLQIAISVRLHVLKETQVPPRWWTLLTQPSRLRIHLTFLIFYQRFVFFFFDHLLVPALAALSGWRLRSGRTRLAQRYLIMRWWRHWSGVLAVHWCSSTPGGSEGHLETGQSAAWTPEGPVQHGAQKHAFPSNQTPCGRCHGVSSTLC